MTCISIRDRGLSAAGCMETMRHKTLMRDRAEWRTLCIAAGCYLIWFAIVFVDFPLPLPLRLLILVPTLTLHSSLQHEAMHGHPFRRQGVNDLLVWLPIGLLVPYARFKATHLRHHVNENIADPYDDPESWYVDRPIWQRKPPAMKALFRLNNTLAGRMVLGPAIGWAGFVASDWRRWREGRNWITLDWLLHGVAATLLALLVAAFGQFSAWLYLLCAYAAMGLLMVRSFLEHQAHERTGSRSVIIEDRGPFALLFLNNNLHSVHHAYPSLAWYRLPAFFRENRDRFLKMNGGYRYDSYSAIFRLFAFKAKEPVEYPLEPRQR